MDTATAGLIGAAIGGGITLVGTIGSNFFLYLKEKHQWERQQQAERDKKLKETQEREWKELFEAYTNCLKHLSVLAVLHLQSLKLMKGQGELNIDDDQLTKDRLIHLKNVQKWLSQIVLRMPADDPTFDEAVRAFWEFPHDFNQARTLREKVKMMARSDPRLKSKAV